MSVFRPLNSDESNLFTIRCVVTFSSTLNAGAMITGGSKITVETNFLTTPTSNNLPDYFGIYTDNGGKFYVTYGKEFTSTPCVSITPRMSTDTDIASNTGAGDNPTPVTYWNNVLKYESATYPSATNYNFMFAFKDTLSGNLISPTATALGVRGFDLVITGPVKLGVTTGNSNKGWSVGSGNDATTAYSYMDIGIGQGNPTCALDVKGGFKTTTLAYTHNAIDGVTQTVTANQPTSGITIPVSNTGKLVTLNCSGGNIVLDLPTPAAGLNFDFVLIADAGGTYSVTITSTSDGSTAATTSFGKLNKAGTSTVVEEQDVFTFNTTGKIGDRAKCICDGTNWHWDAHSIASDGISLA